MPGNNRSFSIAVITCWYGPYPWYFPYFINSCSFNSTIDFYIITDNMMPILDKPDNVHIVKMSLENIKNVAFDKLGFSVNLDYSYKLCEFKPAYGFLFSEIIKGYDFWANADIDLVYGCIRDFITSDMLREFDFVSLRHDYTTGCFALYRNCEKMNTIFKRSKDYQFVFSSPEYHNFDECGFAFHDLHIGKSIFDSSSRIESLTHIIKKAKIDNDINAHFDFILMEGATGRVTFDNGRIFYKNEFEAILYHLVTFKKKCVTPKEIKSIPFSYRFTPTKIIH